MSVRLEVADHVATVTLDRPDAMNALITEMKTELRDILRRVAADDDVRAVLLTGSGRAFCVGQDLREHAANLESDRGLADTVREHYNPIVRTIAGMAKPVVAAVNGVAAGAGASLAFACDLRIAAENAKFAMAFTGIGLAPDSGASWTLQRLVGPAVAAEMLLLGEPVPAQRALELGLVNRVVPGAELPRAARELAVRLAQGPTTAYAATKRALAFAASHTLAQSLDLEAELQDACAATRDHIAATRAFLAKERPVFEGR
ncbi:enoyl-CoA hydratase-related protein [Thermostaphylospora chromogena]|mgnify:CR=1 FL=1|uniref:2-(1,2-epoxy-1,2-dihydrophenyl)acetyl-CoA isomerase n=1 Tax=Thermostaphylospora chromogena TaxID=35622 RepID=A0A1H1B0A5_9ACTN|nr:enoyl-CoA hydratase-related protein [Thermostaphylospora chromogena]SDQ45354.1 2-(1,2-epoxy-1,2-dihydrophenyl)acetyl-CoA isomerase [Thermostaphylospora chromogena]